MERENLLLDVLWAEGDYQKLATLAQRAVAAKPDLIFAATTTAAKAAQRETAEIPIVFALPIDPIGDGLIRDWSRPGGNLTGLSTISRDIAPKRVQLLKECIPALANLLILNDPGARYNDNVLEVVKSASARLGIAGSVLNAASEQELVSGLGAERSPADALFVMESPLFFRYRARIISWANERKLAAVYPIGEYATDGGLLAYGVNYASQMRRAAVYVDKILRGAKPGELAVEQPTSFELIVNLTAATALGLRIPSGVRLRADRLIE